MVLALAAAAGSGEAQGLRVEGSYAAEGAKLLVVVLDRDSMAVAASSTVVNGACSGRIAGSGSIRNHTLRLIPHGNKDEPGSCVLEVKFSKDGKRATVTGQRCEEFHGAACGWEGQTLLRR